jgi:hypothetical protein
LARDMFANVLLFSTSFHKCVLSSLNAHIL